MTYGRTPASTEALLAGCFILGVLGVLLAGSVLEPSPPPTDTTMTMDRDDIEAFEAAADAAGYSRCEEDMVAWLDIGITALASVEGETGHRTILEGVRRGILGRVHVGTADTWTQAEIDECRQEGAARGEALRSLDTETQ